MAAQMNVHMRNQLSSRDRRHKKHLDHIKFKLENPELYLKMQKEKRDLQEKQDMIKTMIKQCLGNPNTKPVYADIEFNEVIFCENCNKQWGVHVDAESSVWCYRKTAGNAIYAHDCPFCCDETNYKHHNEVMKKKLNDALDKIEHLEYVIESKRPSRCDKDDV